MNIPKIEVEGYRLDTFNSTNVINITLRNASSTSVDAEWLWSVVTSIGNITYSNTSLDYITLTCELNVFSTVVTLTLDNGFSCNIRILSDGANVFYAGINIDVFILPENNIQFATSGYTEALVGSSTATYTAFTFDATSDAIIDDTSSIPVVFSHTYNSNKTATIGATTIVGSLSTTIGVEPYGVGCKDPILKDLIVNSVGECTGLEVWSQTVNYVEKLIGRGDVDNSSMSYLQVDTVINCCESGATSFKLAPLYEFSLAASNCVQDEGHTIVVGADLYDVWNTTVTLSGIDLSLISSLKYSGWDRTQPTVLQLENIPPINTFVVEYLLPAVNPLAPVIIDTFIVEVTTVAGFVYTFSYELTPNNTCSNIEFEIVSITYPENPCYVEIIEDVDRTYLSIDSQLLFGCIDTNTVALEAMTDGIYTISLQDSGISNEIVSGCEFVNCDTRCQIIEALAKQCDPVIVMLYDALVDAKECNNITCENMCDLYEMLQALLSACNCTNYANRVVEKKPCKTCK